MPRSKAFRVVMIPTANGGVNYYRLATFAWAMRKFRNVQVAVYSFQYNMNDPHPWQRDILTNPTVRREITNLCEMADVVVWQPCFYGHTLEFFMELRAKFDKPFVVETDDNYIDVPQWNEAFHSFAPNSQVRAMAVENLKVADGLVVSTPFLAETYAQFNENITVIPNSMDFSVWDKVRVDKHRYTRIGWIGGRTHVQDLMIVAPVLKEILTKRPNVWFYVVNSALKTYAKHKETDYVFKGMANVYYTDKNAPINLYPRFMAHFNFDIGIAPLEDCNFNRGKSNLRWLEYSALKIPTVATKVGHFAETIRHKKDGFLVDNNDLDAWKSHLEGLIEDQNLRREIGNAAYKRVKTDFNVRKTASKYLKALKSIAGYGVMNIPPIGGNDEQDAALHAGRGLNERPEPRPLHYVAN